jgi:LacI family transcriptional regulator
MAAGRTVLLLSDNTGDDYVGRIRNGVAAACGPAGLVPVSVNVHGTALTVQEVVQRGDYAAVILTPPVSDDRPLMTMLEKRNLPYVRIAPMIDPGRGNIVSMDELMAASAITGLLTARGHRRIGIVRGPRVHLVSMRRYNGYANALGSKGLRVDPALVVQGDFTRESGKTEAAKLFAARPTAIFASNDEMAAGVIDAARLAGIAIPEQISIVGYDDAAVASRIKPRLTTVRQPLEAMGKAAVQLLADTLRNPRKPVAHTVVPFEIIERESIADCRE